MTSLVFIIADLFYFSFLWYERKARELGLNNLVKSLSNSKAASLSDCVQLVELHPCKAL